MHTVCCASSRATAYQCESPLPHNRALSPHPAPPPLLPIPPRHVCLPHRRCVFDFDDTLRVGKNKDDVAKDANGIVQACKVAAAGGGCGTSHMCVEGWGRREARGGGQGYGGWGGGGLQKMQ